MAKVRLTKKEVLKMFKEVDFVEDCKGTGLSKEAIEEKVTLFSTRLKENKEGEAVEREIIDELTSYFGGVFAKDIAAIDRRIVNSSFEAQRTREKLARMKALQGVFDAARTDFVQEEGKIVEPYERGMDSSALRSKVAADALAAAEEQIKAAEAEKKRQQDIIDAKKKAIEDLLDANGEFNEQSDAYKAAVAADKRNYYLNTYAAAYVGESFGKIQRLIRGYKLDAEGKVDLSKIKDLDAFAAEVEKFVEAKVEAQKTKKNDQGYVVVDATVKASDPAYRLFDERIIDNNLDHMDQRATVRASVQLMREQIVAAEAAIARADANISQANLSTAENQKIKANADRHHKACTTVIDRYNANLAVYDKNISAAKENVTDAEGRVLSEIEYSRAARIRLAEEILENELDGQNPLLQLAYEGYIANLKEQDRIAAKFKSDASDELAEIMKNDFELSSEDYMAHAFEHYIAAGYGSGRSNDDLIKLQKNAKKYFGKYIPDVAGEYKKVIRRYTVAADSFEYFEREVLAVDYVGKTKTKEYDEEIEQALQENAGQLDSRVVKGKNRLELLNPDYDRISKFVKNPTVKDYMALTMLRETLLAEQRQAKADGRTFERAGMLAEVSRRVRESIETARKTGTVIDLTEATQVAVETLIPGYDEICEFAKTREIDIRTPEGKAELATLQKEFEAQSVLAKANVADISRVVDFLNTDKAFLQGAERDQFIREHMVEISECLQSSQPRLHPALSAFKKEFDFTSNETLQASLEALQKDPAKVAKIFKAYGKAEIQVTEKDGELMIAAPGQQAVVVDPKNLANKDFLISTGLMLEMPAQVAAQNRQVASTVEPIATFLQKRDSLCCVKTKGGKDMGILGQASIYVAQKADFDLAAARDELREIYADPKTLKDFKAANPTITDPKAELMRQYQLAYAELMDKYSENKQEIAQMTEQDELAIPVAQRENNDPTKKERNDIYDNAGIQVDKQTQYRGGVARTNALVEKVNAIQDARLVFANASEEGVELLDEGIATAVVDMLQKLEEIKIARPEYLDKLNQAIAESLAQKVEREDEFKVNMDEDKKLSLSIGEKTFSVGEDGKVIIEQREATQTVSDNLVQ